MRKKTVYLLLTLGPGTVSAETAFIIVIEWPSWRIVDAVKRKSQLYETTPVGFAGASLDADEVFVTTEAEVLRFGLSPLRVRQITTNTFLNAVHHVVSTKRGIVVVNTGLDCLELFDRQFKHQGTILLTPLFDANLGYLLYLLRDDILRSLGRLRKNRYLYRHLKHRVPCRNILKLFSPIGHPTK